MRYVPSAPIHIVPNGFDPARFYPSASDDALRASLHIPHDAFVLVTASRLVRKNGIDIVLDALVSAPSVHLIVLGDGEEREQLHTQAEQSGIADRVHWIGTVSNHELLPYFHIATMFIVTGKQIGRAHV